MMAIYVKLNPCWKRKLRQTRDEPSIDDLVQRLELKESNGDGTRNRSEYVETRF
jgi:hypothetical protein